MDYPSLAPVGVAIPESYYCPYGCKAPECDANGYCGHLVGFTTDREVIEPLIELLRYSSEKGAWYPTGWMTVSLADREMVQPEDEIVNPIKRETIPKTGQEYDKFLWVSFRVYSDNPDREPIPFVAPKVRGPRVKNPVFEFKARAKKYEEQLSAPAPDADIEVNPRKQQRAKKNKEAAVASDRTAKKRISTAMTAAGAEANQE